MILEHYPQPETGENWLIVRRIGATSVELWRPIYSAERGVEVLHLHPFDRARLGALRATGLRPRVRAEASQWYTFEDVGRYGVTASANVRTTHRELAARVVLPFRECYEYAGTYYDK